MIHTEILFDGWYSPPLVKGIAIRSQPTAPRYPALPMGPPGSPGVPAPRLVSQSEARRYGPMTIDSVHRGVRVVHPSLSHFR